MSWLRFYLFTVYVAGIHWGRIKGDVIFDGSKGRSGFWIEPSHIINSFIADSNVIVGTAPFPLAEGCPRALNQVLLFDVFGWNVVDGGMAGF
jgi:hypothetical protein